MITLLTATLLHIDMYQDRNNRENTIIIIETDKEVKTYTVKTKDIDKFKPKELYEEEKSN
jgi:hypothetical protein